MSFAATLKSLACAVFTAAVAVLPGCASGPLEPMPLVYPATEELMHRPVFRNDWIHVYEVKMAAGEESFYHRHTSDQLGISSRTLKARGSAVADGDP